MRARRRPVRLGEFVVAAALCAAGVSQVHAACNVIPEAPPTFRAAVGTTNRPFAAPGEPVQLTVGVGCKAGLPGLAPDPAGNVVTVLFTPPTGARSAVVTRAS